MPAALPLVRCAARPRPVVLAVLLVLTLAAGAARASEAAPAHAPEAPLAKKKDKASAAPERATVAPAPTSPAASAAPAAPAALDPMETLRKRLAHKLGGAKAVEADSGSTIRIVSKATDTAPAYAANAATADHVLAASRPARRNRAAEPAHEAHWNYAGDTAGQPPAWGRLKPEFATCSSGKRQSPIDIRDGIRVDLEPVRFDYKPSAFRVLDNGHTVQVNVGPGNAIEVSGRRFELVQFHFHRPSEERIAGRQFEMVVHLVHKDLDGRLAVVAVLLDRGPAQPIVQTVWNNLPLEKGDEVAARGLLNVAELLPAERSYYTYMGSLTTPPCSEGVLWMVLKAPVAVSADQIGIFARLYPMNARPIQSASGRLIKESN